MNGKEKLIRYKKLNTLTKTVTRQKQQFKLSYDSFTWHDGEKDNPFDLCLHGVLTVQFGEEILSGKCCVSAAAFNFLKTLDNDHNIGQSYKMMPCCGHSIFVDGASINIGGCENGSDFAVLHDEDTVYLKTNAGKRHPVAINEYRRQVLKFARTVKNHYASSLPKILPKGEYEKKAYLFFWEKYVKYMQEGMGYYNNDLFVVSLGDICDRYDIDIDCGEPYDAENKLRSSYVNCCTSTTLRYYKAREFKDNLTVIYEDKYNDADNGELKIVQDCLKYSHCESLPFSWYDDSDGYDGTRHIFKVTDINTKVLFKNIMLSRHGLKTNLECAVYIIDESTGQVFFLYDDKGFAFFTD